MSPLEIPCAWKRAQDALRSADLLAKEGHNEGAVSRAYYAMFYAARAALYFAGVPTPRTHSGMIHLFHEQLVRTGAVEKTWHDALAAGYDARGGADYDIETFLPAENVTAHCDTARKFVERIRRHLLEHGMSEAELNAGPPVLPSEHDNV